VAAYGEDADALLNACDIASLYADEAKIGPADIELLAAGVASRPVYDFTGAVLEGRVQRALELLHAGQGMEGPEALAALHNELRRMLACQESDDDGQVQAWLGAKGSLYYARRRAGMLNRNACLRLLGDVIHAQRRCRQSGVEPLMLTELTVLHAQRVLRPSGRAVGDGGSRHAANITRP
jgi:DNA polymerase III delta subunit